MASFRDFCCSFATWAFSTAAAAWLNASPPIVREQAALPLCPSRWFVMRVAPPDLCWPHPRHFQRGCLGSVSSMISTHFHAGSPRAMSACRFGIDDCMSPVARTGMMPKMPPVAGCVATAVGAAGAAARAPPTAAGCVTIGCVMGTTGTTAVIGSAAVRRALSGFGFSTGGIVLRLRRMADVSSRNPDPRPNPQFHSSPDLRICNNGAWVASRLKLLATVDFFRPVFFSVPSPMT